MKDPRTTILTKNLLDYSLDLKEGEKLYIEVRGKETLNLGKELVQPGKELRSPQLTCIPVSMRCKGNLKQIFEFFTALQASERLIRIEQVKLVNDNDFTGDVTMQTEAVIYYRTKTDQG